jgi:non-ribosomal peptide synthetase component F
MSGNPALRDLLLRVREVTLGAYAHQDIPFEALVELLQPDQDLRCVPFRVAFTLQNAPLPALDLPPLTLDVIEVDRGVADYDLALSIADTDGSLSGKWMYSTDLFAPRTIRRMAEDFQTVLEGMVADPMQSIANLVCIIRSQS